jgi:hypothetical protein
MSTLYIYRMLTHIQIFIADNSTSMMPYWDEVKRTFEVLAYLVKDKDPDGIELRFTNSTKLHGRNKNRKPLMKMLNTAKLDGGQCVIGLTLGSILKDLSSESANDLLTLPFRWRKKKYGVNIYVLTDGIWEDGEEWLEEIVEPIKKLVDKGMRKEQMGIQFIQFGGDAEGTRRFQILDDGLRQHGLRSEYYFACSTKYLANIPRDFVDTEPWKGNVYKMLLGAIDPAWDRVRTADHPKGTYLEGISNPG